MTLMEFGQRFLNYKAFVSVRNAKTGKVEFSGLYLDCPLRYLRFGDVERLEIDNELNVLIVYVLCNSSMYYHTAPHFLDSGIDKLENLG